MTSEQRVKNRVFTSLDFFIFALMLLTLAAFIFKSQLAGFFRGREAESEVRIELSCAGTDVDFALSLSEGDEVKTEGCVLGNVISVSAYEEPTEGTQVLVSLNGRASRGPDGVWSFSGLSLPTGELIEVSSGSEFFNAWIIEIVPRASAQISHVTFGSEK